MHGGEAAIVLVRLDRQLVVDAEREKRLRLPEDLLHHLARNAVVLNVEETEVLARLRWRGGRAEASASRTSRANLYSIASQNSVLVGPGLVYIEVEV